MKKSEISEKENVSISNRVSWYQLDNMNSEEKEKMIDENGCIFVFDSKKMEIYKIEKVDL